MVQEHGHVQVIPNARHQVLQGGDRIEAEGGRRGLEAKQDESTVGERVCPKESTLEAKRLRWQTGFWRLPLGKMRWAALLLWPSLVGLLREQVVVGCPGGEGG